MPAYKRKYRSGKVAWYYQFAPLGSTRQNQNLVTESGFATKQEATAAEAVRRTEEMVREAATPGVAAPMPTTLAMLLTEFMKQHAEENLAPKTVERYREMAEYVTPELLAMNLAEITPLHLSREWMRLLKCGGHVRTSKATRAMKPKTVRNIAGLVSSAFARAIKWGLTATNPVTHSDLPKVRKRIGMALLPSEQDRLTQCATGPWCLPVFLDVASSTGARRGEVLALRWSDVKGMIVFIDRSLCQTRTGLVFKSTKSE